MFLSKSRRTYSAPAPQAQTRPAARAGAGAGAGGGGVSSSAGGGAAARRQKLPSLQDDVKEFLRGATLTPKDANAEQSLNTPSPASVPDSLEGVRQLVRHGEWERVRQLAARCISHPGAVPVPAADVLCMRAHMVTALLHLRRHKDVANVFADEAVR